MKDYNKDHWLRTTVEFNKWKKTDNFQKWRRRQFLKQGGLCWYCGDFLPLAKINVEHKTARSLGGANNKNNLVLCCSGCNKTKGSSTLTVQERTRLNKQNKGLRGTYLKNKQHFNSLYGEYSDEALYEKLKSML